MDTVYASIPEFVASHIVDGALVDLRHAERMLVDVERQASDPPRANRYAIRAARETLSRIGTHSAQVGTTSPCMGQTWPT
jgi:hypothetical protein